MTKKTVIELPSLAAAFVKLAENRNIEVHEIEGLGKVGLKQLSISGRDRWLEEKDSSTACLLQSAVCDPETGELVLKHLSYEDIKELPMNIVDELARKIFKQNNFKTVKELKQDDAVELKNSVADQS